MFEVQNQPPPLEPYNLFASDVVLYDAVQREGAGWAKGGTWKRCGVGGDGVSIRGVGVWGIFRSGDRDPDAGVAGIPGDDEYP